MTHLERADSILRSTIAALVWITLQQIARDPRFK